MGLFDRLFGIDRDRGEEPNLRFGRYSDAYKSSKKYRVWDDSMRLYEQGKYLSSYQVFLDYLKDEKEENVTYEVKGEEIYFSFLQGSKKVVGTINNTTISAVAKIVHCKDFNVAFMRNLLEKNYHLKYSKYAIDKEDDITITFHSSILDSSPMKLYYAFKELAVNADKEDDLLVNRFGPLEIINNRHVNSIDPEIKKIFYDYFIEEINKILSVNERGILNAEKYAGGISYTYLHLAYKLDYLIKPEGLLMEEIEKIHRTFFAEDGRNSYQKNQEIFEVYQKMKLTLEEDFYKELYNVTSTFGITSPVGHDRVVNFIDGELSNMNWYEKNGHSEIALAVPGYIVGYCTFYYSVPRPDREYFHLFYEITEGAFFKKLGYNIDFYNASEKKFNSIAIKKEIKHIAKINRAFFPHLHPDLSILNFNSLASFSRSYMIMIRNLDLTN